MIYLDSSVAIAQLLAEDRCPPQELWSEELITSRLLEYELWNAIHRRGLERSHGEAARNLVDSLAVTELSREVLRRANEPFPSAVRTLDAIHLSTLLFLLDRGLEMRLASYDRRLIEAASALDIPLAPC